MRIGIDGHLHYGYWEVIPGGTFGLSRDKRKDMSAATGLDGLLEPLIRCLDTESARRVVELQVAAPVQERIDMLAERANDGTLSNNERLEYELLINAADFISILKLKARRHLDSTIQ
jgi:hypothetical protein